MKKPNKRDRILIKSYQIINQLNFSEIVVEKLVAIQLSEFCEAKKKLSKDQLKGIKQRSTIDAAALMIHKVHKMWENQHIAGVFLIDVKGAFDHVSQARLAKIMADLEINNNLIG